MLVNKNGKQNIFWIFLILVVDYSYLTMFTFDSAHYLRLASIIGGELSWKYWDPIRGIIFPLLLRISTFSLGENINAYITFFSLLHCILFFCLSLVLQIKLNITNNKELFFVRSLIFIFILIDPIIFGYYHVVLTEGVAATLLILSVLIAYKLYGNVLENVSFNNNILLLLFFYIFVPFGWHLKQPYVFIPLGPLALTTILVFLKSKDKKVKRYFGIHFLSIILFLGVSIFSWNIFINTVRQNDPGRTSEAWIAKEVNRNFKLIRTSPLRFGVEIAKNYFALSNVFYYNQTTNKIDTSVSFIRSSENEAIAYKIYDNGDSNSFYVPESLRKYVLNYTGAYHSPERLNNSFRTRFIESNFLFSCLYLSLPIIFFVLCILLVYNKGKIELDFICLGAILANAIVYSLSGLPIDRYLFSGYPLLLLFLLIYIYRYIKLLIERVMHFMRTNDE